MCKLRSFTIFDYKESTKGLFIISIKRKNPYIKSKKLTLGDEMPKLFVGHKVVSLYINFLSAQLLYNLNLRHSIDRWKEPIESYNF